MTLADKDKIRSISGITSTTDVTDADLDVIIAYVDAYVRKDVFQHVFREDIGPNIDTGDTWNGVNYTFTVKSPPIADSDFSGTVDASDIEVKFLDADGGINDATVTVVDAENGIITAKDGTDPISSDTEWVKCSYYRTHKRLDTTILEGAANYLGAHLAMIRLTEPDKVTLADLDSNRMIVELHPSRFLTIYNKKIRQIHVPKLRSC